MSVKASLLALLAERPMYGAQLRAEFESRTGGTWPLNVGQVYTTLGRLERDGLVEPAGPADGEGRISYRLTERGRAETAAWWDSPVPRDDAPRDELVIKLALAVTTTGIDVQRVLQRQRTATLKHLRDLTRLKADQPQQPKTSADLAWGLVLENHLFAAEAEVRWLDHIEATLARHREVVTPGQIREPLSSPPEPSEHAEKSTESAESAKPAAHVRSKR